MSPPSHLPHIPLQNTSPNTPSHRRETTPHPRARKPATAPETPYPDLLATLTTARNPPQTAFSHPSVIPVKTGITPLKPRTAQTDGYRDQYVLTPTLPNGKFPMLCDSGMEESRHPKIAELRKFMLHRPSKAVMAKIVEAFGALLAALTQPFVSHDVGYAQVVPGQKSRKVRNHMLKSPFKSVIARAATFALVLALGIAFVSVGMNHSASAQEALEEACETDDDGVLTSCAFEYDENGTDSVADFSAMDPEGEDITWDVVGTDASKFDITGGVLTFKDSPDYEDPKDADRVAVPDPDNPPRILSRPTHPPTTNMCYR